MFKRIILCFTVGIIALNLSACGAKVETKEFKSVDEVRSYLEPELLEYRAKGVFSEPFYDKVGIMAKYKLKVKDEYTKDIKINKIINLSFSDFGHAEYSVNGSATEYQSKSGIPFYYTYDNKDEILTVLFPFYRAWYIKGLKSEYRVIMPPNCPTGWLIFTWFADRSELDNWYPIARDKVKVNQIEAAQEILDYQSKTSDSNESVLKEAFWEMVDNIDIFLDFKLN